MMKRHVIKILVLLFLIVGLAACNNKAMRDYKLKVIETSWSGGSLDNEHEDKTFEYDIVLNKKYIVRKGNLGLTFTIKKINKDKLYIETTDRFSNQKSGVNLRSNKKKFMLKKDMTLELTTPTMDSGCIYYLSLEKV